MRRCLRRRCQETIAIRSGNADDLYPTKLTLGRAIRDARTRRKLTQQQLADAMRVSRSALTQWERDTHRPVNERLARLSELLGCDLADAAGATMPATNGAVSGHRWEMFQQCDASLLEVMHPLWRPRELIVFATRESDDPAIDLLITPDIALRARTDLFTDRSGTASGVVVQGSRLQPFFDQGALMLLNGSRTVGEGDTVLVLGSFADGLRPARFGRFIRKREGSLTLLHHASAAERTLSPSECEALFLVVPAAS